MRNTFRSTLHRWASRSTLAALFLVGGHCAVAQLPYVQPIIPVDIPGAYMQLNIQTDFGAVPGTGQNNHLVFQAAAKFFSQRGGNGLLKIPAGVYLVGRQGDPVPGETWFNPNGYTAHQDVMLFEGCSNLVIQGTLNPDGSKASIIRYQGCLLYGRFDMGSPVLTAYVPHPSQTSCSPYVMPPGGQVAAIGIMFKLEGCNGVRIMDLELDGNLKEQLLGGGVSCADDGIQLAYDGIVLGRQDFGSTVNHTVRLNNLNVHHFGRDGMIILRGDQAMALRVVKCSFDHNERMGVAWVSGSEAYFEDCSFNYNSTGRIRSAMGVGLDIEHEFGTKCGNGRFLRCSFLHNRVSGMITNTASIGSDVVFDECVFKSARASFPTWTSPTSTAVWPTGPYLRFNSCKFYGPIIRGYHNPKTAENCHTSDVKSTQFNFCSFYEADENVSYFDWTPVGSNYTVPPLVHMNPAASTQFYGCHFEASCRSRFLQVSGAPNPSGCLSCSNNIVFTACSFLSHGSWGATTAPALSMFTGANVTFNDATVSWPNRVRTSSGALLSPSWNYRMNIGPGNGFAILGTGCSNWVTGSEIELGGSSNADALQYYDALQCKPLFVNPNTPQDVIHSSTSGPLLIPVNTTNCKGAGLKSIHVEGPPPTVALVDGMMIFTMPESSSSSPGRLLDATGKVLKSYNVVPGVNSLDIQHLANGLYFLQFEDKSAPIRFMVSH